MTSRNGDGGGYYMTHSRRRTVGRRRRKIKLRDEQVDTRHTHHTATYADW